MDARNTLMAAARNPLALGAALKAQTGKPVVGHFCSYTPEELITAAGAIPFRLFGGGDDISLADRHLQSYCCSLVRGGLEDALKGNLKFLDGAVFPHTCDSIQRLSDIWRLCAGMPFHIDVVLPVKLDTESARAYMMDVLTGFRADLEAALGVSITDDRLREAVRLYNDIRRTLSDLYRLRSEHPGAISAGDLNLVVKAAMIMDRQTLAPLLHDLKDSLASNPPPAARPGKRVILSGGVCHHPDIYGVLEDSGAQVIWDDLCTGTRYFEGQLEENIPPLKAVADRYFNRMVCPAKHFNLTGRGENLVQLARTQGAAGVIFLFLKFCDPHSFDYPYLKQFLDDAGIPSILLEVEARLPPEGQLRTRFEAFVDMLD